MRVLLTGGMTAGHINPALAIAETILQNDPNSKIAFVGIRGGKEEDLVPREGYPLYYVKSKGISRKKLSLSNVSAYWTALTSPYSPKTVRIIKGFQPDIVIGTGGYACWPIMAAASRMGIPTAVHESNAFAGLAVRRLQRKVDRIWINFEETEKYIRAKDKIVRVGNPLRCGFGALTRDEARKKLRIPKEKKLILSFGGSLGAEQVNRAVLDMMKYYSSLHKEIIHVHASGKAGYEEMRERFSELGLHSCKNCVLIDYIYDMPIQMAAADLVISRAGAMTLSELALMQKNCILIPSPNVVDNHQYVNAKALADAKAAFLVEEKDLGDGVLWENADKILSSERRAKSMQRAISRFADKDANRLIWQEILNLTKR